jgi:calcineurin-like phosphoesterase family protein
MNDIRTLFTSDPHFHHKNIVKFTERGKDTTQENHDEWLIKLWNSQVNPWDKVYMLGDFSFSHKYNEVANVTRRLNGQKFFVLGNHDDEDVFEKLKQEGLIQNWYDTKHIKIGSTSAHLYHFPIESWNKSHHGGFHLHGHCHGSLITAGQGKRLDVGLDSAYNILGEHRFFTESDITTIMATRSIHETDHHKDRSNGK